MRRAIFILTILSVLCGGVLTGALATYICTVHPDRIITKTQIIYRNEYQYVGDDPNWNCAGNWYNAYLGLVNDPNNITASHSRDWNKYCPGILQPAN